MYKHIANKVGIKENSKFTLELKNLYFNHKNYELLKNENKLNVYNSQLIEIAKNLYLIFRIIKTNEFETSKETDYIEYKIMYLDGTASELFGGGRFKLESKEVEISEIASTGGNDNLSDYCNSDSDEFEYLSTKFNTIKYNIKIKFE